LEFTRMRIGDVVKDANAPSTLSAELLVLGIDQQHASGPKSTRQRPPAALDAWCESRRTCST